MRVPTAIGLLSRPSMNTILGEISRDGKINLVKRYDLGSNDRYMTVAF